MISRDTREPLLCTHRNICSDCFDCDQSETSEVNMGSKCIPDLLPGFFPELFNASMLACPRYRIYACL